VRFALYFCLLFTLAGIACAQEQEKKLLDRLLKPDMSLQSEAQGKQFVANGATITRKAHTKSFFVSERKPERGFWNTKRVDAKEFATESSRDAQKTANLSTRTRIAKADVPYSTSIYGDVRTLHDAGKAAPVSDYPGTRPFLDKGKSQKSLSAQHPPLTIDEVRELLNKNK
jgi:hypothetical protein